MPSKLMITYCAAALAIVSVPAFAVDIPDSGSKNFSPAGDTPTYFTNESVPISARTADTNASDFTAEEAAAPVPAVTVPAAHPNTGRHGRYGSVQRSVRHTLGQSRGTYHSTHFTTAATQTGTVSKQPASAVWAQRKVGRRAQ
jgi:hypothetical protein